MAITEESFPKRKSMFDLWRSTVLHNFFVVSCLVIAVIAVYGCLLQKTLIIPGGFKIFCSVFGLSRFYRYQQKVLVEI